MSDDSRSFHIHGMSPAVISAIKVAAARDDVNVADYIADVVARDQNPEGRSLSRLRESIMERIEDFDVGFEFEFEFEGRTRRAYLNEMGFRGVYRPTVTRTIPGLVLIVGDDVIAARVETVYQGDRYEWDGTLNADSTSRNKWATASMVRAFASQLMTIIRAEADRNDKAMEERT